jgi:hypothetical protein
MAYDLTKSHFSLSLEKGVITGQTIEEEGLCLIMALEDGVEKVQASTGGGGEVFVGFSIRDNADNATNSVVEEGSVPAAAPYTVQLSHTNIISAGGAPYTNITVWDDTNNVAVTPQAAPGGGGTVVVNLATGLLTFDVAEAGIDFTIRYRYNLTVEESKRLFYERSVNNSAAALLEQITVGGGHGEIYTNQYDAGINWAALATPVPELGLAGVISNGSGDVIGRVIQVPTVDDPRLGVAFDVTP